MSGITGNLISDSSELKRLAGKKAKEFVELSVANRDLQGYKDAGWEIVRKNISTVRIRKMKNLDEIFEDRVWLVFYKLGFQEMNADRNCKLIYRNGYTKQIDVLARDKDNAFIVDCRSSQESDPINVREKLEEFAGNEDDIKHALESTWGRHFGRTNILIAISSRNKREADQRFVNTKNQEGKNLLLWSSADINYIEKLIVLTGDIAKYQLYSVIFTDKKQKRLKKEYAALRSKRGNQIFYSFLISAKDLLNYAYIHHRELTGIVEASEAYQRMLRPTKLKEISKYVDEEDGFFPNSIIVNFSESIQWKPKQAIGDARVGTVTLPGCYGCAWIIDGQHRLYGAAMARKDIVLPVLAFEKLEEREQAELFVEINEKQTTVPANLRWDLYSDIYLDSADEKQRLLYQIAETAKLMNASGPFEGLIDIPSMPAEGAIKLTLTTICSTIKAYAPWDALIHPTDESKTPDNAARLINLYFDVLKSLWLEDWQKVTDSVLLSNNGFGVFMMVFHDILNDLVYKQKQALLRPNKAHELNELLKENYLTPLIEFLKAEPIIQNDIRTQTGRGSQSYNAGVLDLKIQEFIRDFSPPRISELPIIPPKEPPVISIIEEKARCVEPILREFVLAKLKLTYGSSRWWKQGIPGRIKDDADNKWAAEISRKPYLRQEGEQNEKKFEFFGLGEIKEVIVYGQNWEKIFGPLFISKHTIERRSKDIAALRNPVQHVRKIDDLDVADGLSGLLWLSNCLNIRDLNPYL